MKHRITFARQRGVEFKRSQIGVEADAVKIVSLSGSKEYRLTVGFDELPSDLVDALEQCQELRIRWASPEPYNSTSPFESRIAPGLHVFITPRHNHATDLLCSTLKEVYSPELKCSSYNTTFTSVPVLSTRFSSSASTQFYSPLDSLGYLALYLQQQVCSGSDTACQEAAFSLLHANRFDVDFDAISRVVVVSAYWSKPLGDATWNENINRRKGDRVEVGVLVEEPAERAEELKVGGWLTVVGEDTKPGATLFSFPSRHHSLPNDVAKTYGAAFDQPAGLHPTLRISFPQGQPLKPPLPQCGLHAYLSLPSWLFLDRYTFADSLALSANNLTALHALEGTTDLEAPEWASDQWGSAALLEISVPTGSTSSEHSASVPMHMRYLTPAHGGFGKIVAPWPAVFWACPIPQGKQEYEGPRMDTNSFDKTNLGWDGLFGERTLFYHFEPAVDSRDLYEKLPVPVLDIGAASYIETTTVFVVILGLLWTLWNLFKPKPVQRR